MNRVATLNRLFSLIFVFFVAQTFGQQQQQPSAVMVSESVLNTFIVVHRAPDSKLWQSATLSTNSEGDVSTNYQSYTELATGLCYTNAAGQLADTLEEVVSADNGAEAVHGPHKVQWAYDTDTPGGLVNVQTPDGQQISCVPFGLAYYDLSSGSNAALGRLQASTGMILPPNQVIYQNAFSNLTADLLYTYTKAGLSQDIVLRQALPPPDAFGLSDSNTVLQVYSQFTAPEPTATVVTNEGVLDDEVLDFGTMQMGVGTSLFIDDNQTPLTIGNVGKQWIHISTNTYLIESVPWTSVSSQLGQMPHASNLNPRRASIRGLALLDEEPKKRDARKPKKQQSTMKLAKAAIGGRRLVVDYNLTGTSSNLTMQGDTTYLVTSTVNVTNLLTIEGGSVVKFTNLAQINVTGPGSNIACQTGPYRPSVWTSINDNSVGVTVTGSTGTPTVGTNTYLNFTVVSNQPMTLRYLRFSYASTAIAGTVNHSTSDWIKLWDCQFYNCGTGFSSTVNNTVFLYAYNVLFSRVTNAFYGNGTNSTTYVAAQNVTADRINYFTFNIYSGNVTAVNSLFTSVTNGVLSANKTDCPSPGGVIYQPTGAGSYYLTNGVGSGGHSLKNAGTTSIDSGLLQDLATLTTYPPTVIQSNITGNTILGTNGGVPRNTGAPDIGYHYPPLDWAVNTTVSSATITVQPGTALGMFGSNSGIYLQAGGVLNCAGTAANPVYITRYNTVQEQSITNWASANWIGSVEVPDNSGQVVSSVFTDWSVLASDGQLDCSAALQTPQFGFQNSQFYAGQFYVSGGSVSSTNSLYWRVATQLRDVLGNANSYYNNLFWQGSLLYNHTSSGVWTFRENLFDQNIITNLAAVNIEVCSNNAYATNLITQATTLLTPTNGAVFLTNSPAYFLGGFGQFYYSTTQTNLIFKGSRSASTAGLSNYTSCINNMADGANMVSIGYHFPAQPPTITSQPANVMTTVGGTATFSVGAAGVGTLTYQWYFDGVPLTSQTSSSLTITPVAANNAGTYEVIVTDALGSTASYTVTLQAAQNDFYVNYFSSSPINPMIRGGSDQAFLVSGYAALIDGAFPGTGFRGIAPGDDSQTYNWKTLKSQGNEIQYMSTSGNWTNLPLTTLQYLLICATNGQTPVLTVNCLGDGSPLTTYTTNMGVIKTNNLWLTNGTSLTAIEQEASDWVRYCNFIVPNFCWKNGVATNWPGNTNVLTANDILILTNLSTNWVYGSPPTNAPILLPYNYTGPTNSPVKYWEIGNEVEGFCESNDLWIYANLTNYQPTNYITSYSGITAAMLAVDSTIHVGPGFGSGFLPGLSGTNNNTIITPFLENPNLHYDFIVHHPYPGDLDSYWTNANIQALETNLNDIWNWQDTLRGAMYSDLAAFQGNQSVPLFATEWNGDFSTGIYGFEDSMWTLLADTETVLTMARGQQTMDANYYPDTGPLSSCWPMVFTMLQSNLGNYYVSSSYGNNVGAQYLPTGSTNYTDGSTASPFRVYSMLNSNSAGIVTESVWMLNFSNSASQTVNLHFPAPISGGTNYTLVYTNTTNSLTFQGTYSSGNIYWSNSVISPTNGASMVVTIPQATLMVAQVTYSTTPTMPGVPVITGTPSQGQPGQVITITGNNFSQNLQQNTVYFGPVRGTVVGATTGSLTVEVPYGASYGPITVTVSNLTAYSMSYFNPAYYDASVNNPIVMQAVVTNSLTNTHVLTLSSLSDLVFADLNGDGKPDLAFDGYWDVVTAFQNRGAGPGSFALETNAPYSLASPSYPAEMTFADIDGDGMLDWVWVDNSDNKLSIMRNISSPTNILFGGGSYNVYSTDGGPIGVRVMDIDGDGRPDIVVANKGSNTVSVFRNISSGPGNLTFAPKVDFVACGAPYALALADLDGDGKPDIAVVGYTNSGSNVVVLRNTSTPGTISFGIPVKIDSLNVAQSLAVGDFNGDGKLDLAVGEFVDGINGLVEIYINNSTPGTISFPSGVKAANQTVADPKQITVQDFNGDGRPDFAVVDFGNNMYTFQNLFTGGSFALTNFGSVIAKITGSGSPAPASVASADIDGDGRTDIAVGNYNPTNVVIFQNVSQY